MKIAIIGYGKMGKAVEAAAKNSNHEVVAIVDSKSDGATAAEISAENLNGAEVAIDFTHPDSVLGNIRKLAELKIPIVVGTTGWYDSLPEVEKIAAENSVGILYAGNFSIGVNTFYAIVEHASKLLTGKNFDAAIREIHHTGKADAPSGTAREIAGKIIVNFPEKKEITLDNTEQPVPSEKLQISSARIGKVVGIHEVVFDGASDSIQLIHSGKNRDGYAAGAVSAAEWLVKKNETGMFTAKDWLGF
ncbi:4-hydroxy-tetrahydrodipicolinate reductase [Candidatus Gracilibacteria bacterium]|nr:4-hydroxy-tetrahydrodipicolinate reductase [Candidatus Gracilibacteria bacterium]